MAIEKYLSSFQKEYWKVIKKYSQNEKIISLIRLIVENFYENQTLEINLDNSLRTTERNLVYSALSHLLPKEERLKLKKIFNY